ncbi:S-adenosyl-L-methionine-dependent methyltransferase [Apiosordaria backusii]|uniref:Arsenite methyltransferase n=1 Tax=Apiosordaria backusii TaxID=314023 RepID=A0AA40BRB6_9PEZI|nr:S-adenosyl-L-methionine-dependent methyltransferase [Apiosordaria backusii]
MESTEQIYNQVREHYSTASRSKAPKYGESVAKSFGYTEEELSNIPEDANLGLSCGNPLAITSLKEGETVIDLGSGAGFDIFLASTKIGSTGRAIGVDINDEMLARAEKIKVSRGSSVSNVSFIKGNITSVPLPDETADLIISNCVVNLVPYEEKHLVFREMYRLLKPGGRVAVSDILAKKPLPEMLGKDIAMYVGCIAGAAIVADYEKWFKEAGFKEAVITDTKADLNVYLETNEDGTKKSGDCCGPAAVVPACCGGDDATAAPSCTSAAPSGNTEEKTDLNEFVGSFKIFAVKG